MKLIHMWVKVAQVFWDVFVLQGKCTYADTTILITKMWGNVKKTYGHGSVRKEEFQDIITALTGTLLKNHEWNRNGRHKIK